MQPLDVLMQNCKSSMSHGAQKLQSWDSKYVDDQFLAYILSIPRIHLKRL